MFGPMLTYILLPAERIFVTQLIVKPQVMTGEKV